MRIALIGPGLYPFTLGGIEMAVYHIGKRLAEKHDIIILALRRQKEAIKAGRCGNARVFFIKELRRPYASLLSLLLSPAILLAEKPDVLNAHQALSPMVIATAAALLLRRPLVITCHASDVRLLRREKAIKLVQKICFTLADAVVCVSEEIKRILVDEYGLRAEKVMVIPNGYDEELIDELLSARRPEEGMRRKARICFLGSLRPEKDPLTLLRAIKELREHGQDVEVHIVGGGALKPELEDFCEKEGLADAVVFHGPLPHEKALEVVASSDVSVISSVEEGLPVALVEAMALGRAVVATRVGGIPELVEDGKTGLLVKPRSPDELASAIRRLLSDEELLRGIREEAREKARGRSWRAVSSAYEKLFCSLSSRR